MQDTTFRDDEHTTNMAKPKRDHGVGSPTAIGRRLLALRVAVSAMERRPKKMTQTEFAKRAGLTQNAYTQYENGIRAPSIPAAAGLKKAYDVTLDWIFLGDETHMPYILIDTMRSPSPKR